MAVLDYKPEFMGQPAYPTELHKAADKIDLAEVEKLIAAGAHGLHDCDTVEQTPLIMCVRAHAADQKAADEIGRITQLLIEAGAKVNVADKNGDTALHLAVMDGSGVHKSVAVDALLKAGADPKVVCEHFKKTPLHYAALAGHKEICELLIDAGARKNKINRQRQTPLQVAKEQLQILNKGLNHRGLPYEGDDLEQRKKNFQSTIAYFESVPGIKLD